MKLGILTAGLLSVMCVSPCLADGYLCITEAAAGIGFNKSQSRWAGAAFRSGAKYILRRQKESDGLKEHYQWLLVKFGGSNFPYFSLRNR